MSKKDQEKKTKKASLPPELQKSKKPSGPAGTKKPAGPPAGKKPAGPPSSKSDGPTLPPGFSGDGSGGEPTLSRKDFQTDQDVRWCPGCGDYAILAAVQRLLPKLDVDKENIVFISGIGCSGRFPYYMNTYGMHSIHGRAPAVATGLKATRPELDVWIVTGDGDALSIGGNHLIHLLRRNLNLQLLLFNNQVYGLTKGQYSPTSEKGQVTKSSPHGSIDRPFNPVALALGADASFVARTMDRDPSHMTEVMKAGHAHHGASMIEIYQNCNIFNDGAFFEFTDKDTKAERAIFVEDDKPLLYDNGRRGLRLEGLRLEPVDLENSQWSASDCLTYDTSNQQLAHVVGRLFGPEKDLPRPFGVLYQEERPTYEELLTGQLEQALHDDGKGDLEALLHGGDTWTIDT